MNFIVKCLSTLLPLMFSIIDATRKKRSPREAAHVSYSLDEDEESGDEDYRDAEGV